MRLAGALSTLLVLLILVQISVAVIRRYVFDRPLQWSDEVVGYAVVAMVMLGAAEALRRNDHIAIDLVSTRLGPRLRRVQSAFTELSVVAFALIVGVSIWDSIRFARSFGSYSVGYIEIETWIPQVPVVVGMVLLALTALLRLWQGLRGRSR